MIESCCNDIEVDGRTDALIDDAANTIIEVSRILAKRNNELPDSQILEALCRYAKAKYLHMNGMSIEQSKKESGFDRYLPTIEILVFGNGIDETD